MKVTVSADPFTQGETAEIEIPDGWYRVLSGVVKPGDRFVNERLFWADGIVEWIELPIDKVDFRKRKQHYNTTPQWFTCLIRRGEPVDKQCPSCNEEAIPLGWKVCRRCAYEAVQAMRKANR